MAELVSVSPKSTESSVKSKVYSFKDDTLDEKGRLVEEVIRYGEIQHSTLVEIFGHLMFYDDLKNYAKFPDRCETSYVTVKTKYLNFSKDGDWKRFRFSVFIDTDRTDDYSNLFYEGTFEYGKTSMEPFITLGQIEDELMTAEDEERSSSEATSPKDSIEATSPKATVDTAEIQTSDPSLLPEVNEEGGEGVLSSSK